MGDRCWEEGRVQVTVNIDQAGQLRVETDVNDPMTVLRLLHGAAGAVMQKISEAAAPKTQLLVPTGFKVSAPPGAPGIRGR